MLQQVRGCEGVVSANFFSVSIQNTSVINVKLTSRVLQVTLISHIGIFNEELQTESVSLYHGI